MSLSSLTKPERPRPKDASLDDLNSTIYAMLLAYRAFGDAGLQEKLIFSNEVLEMSVTSQFFSTPNTFTFEIAQSIFLRSMIRLEHQKVPCVNPERMNSFVQTVKNTKVPFDAAEFAVGFAEDTDG